MITPESVISLVIYFIVTLIMFGIGITQLRSEKPVAFYSGEKPPAEQELTDIKSWNQKHGRMWILYGAVILCSYFIGSILGDSPWCILPMCGGLLFPIPVMMWYHHRLSKTYLQKQSRSCCKSR